MKEAKNCKVNDSSVGKYFRTILPALSISAAAVSAAYYILMPPLRECGGLVNKMQTELDGCSYHVNSMIDVFDNAYRSEPVSLFEIR